MFYALAGLYVLIAVLLGFELRTNPAAARAATVREPLVAAFSRMAALTRRPGCG